jgi:hypothetical protein
MLKPIEFTSKKYHFILLAIPPLYMITGKTFVYILFMCVMFFLYMFNDDARNNISLEDNDKRITTNVETLNSHLHKSSIDLFKSLYRKFFESYTILLMDKFSDAEYNLMMQHRAGLLRIVNNVENTTLLGEQLTEDISNNILTNTNSYIDVIHEKYKLRTAKAFPVESNSYQKYDEYF